MEGYVKNISPLWRHAMKRNIEPGKEVPLSELYEQYGVKYEIKEGKPFVDWLRQVKLKDESIWEIRYKGDKTASAPVKEEAPKKVEQSNPVTTKRSQQSPFVKSEAEVQEIVGLSVRQARESLPKMTNQKLLKYALHEASQLANKDTLCRMLRKRIIELELSRR